MTSATAPSSGLARWRHLPGRDRLLLCEAVAALAAARLAVRLLPLRRIAGRATPASTVGTPADLEGEIRRVRWAVRAAARRMPFRAHCLEQGLAARSLLTRRGVTCTLCYGVRREPGGAFSAHLWVRAGDADVIGTEGLETFTLLAEYPPADDEPGSRNG